MKDCRDDFLLEEAGNRPIRRNCFMLPGKDQIDTGQGKKKKKMKGGDLNQSVNAG